MFIGSKRRDCCRERTKPNCLKRMLFYSGKKNKQLMVKCCSLERYNLLFVQREFTIKLQQKIEICKLCFYSVFQSYLNSFSLF